MVYPHSYNVHPQFLNPIPAGGLQRVRRDTRVEDWFVPLLILAAWYILQRWVLPRFGVPT